VVSVNVVWEELDVKASTSYRYSLGPVKITRLKAGFLVVCTQARLGLFTAHSTNGHLDLPLITLMGLVAALRLQRVARTYCCEGTAALT
jgi:hypothetical protein